MRNIIRYVLVLSVLFAWVGAQARTQDQTVDQTPAPKQETKPAKKEAKAPAGKPAQATAEKVSLKSRKAQAESRKIVGVVMDANSRTPLAAAQISSADIARPGVSGPNGVFRINTTNPNAVLTVAKEGYYTRYADLLGRDSVVIYIQPVSRTFAADSYSSPQGERPTSSRIGSATAVNGADISKGYSATSDALTGRFAGLRVFNKGGMPGEGSVAIMRGNRTLLAQNSPLLVVDGIPYLPNTNVSSIINGFSPDIMEPINLKNVEQITLLKGADALVYGSLGSNGVLMIQTGKGTVSQTQVEFQTVEGLGFVDKRIPMLEGNGFKRYIGEIAASRYENSQEISQALPFLSANQTPGQQVRYGFNTDWQKEIYSPAFVSDNMLKVRGGDAVVQYMITAGYQKGNGVVDGTSRDKFYTSGNTNINFSQRLTASASVTFDFMELKLQEQGLVPETNPVLAAYSHSPLTGVYEVDAQGRRLAEYSRIDPVMNISNPAAMLEGIEGKNKIYNILVNTGVNYKFNHNIKADLRFGIYYNYIKDDLFVGGMSSGAIAPLMDGLAMNTVRSGGSEARDYYGRANVSWSLPLTNHSLDVNAGWQIVSSTMQSSSGSGYNTASDRYRTLGNTSNVGRASGGYAEVINWMNAYVTADYSYRRQLFLSATGTVDASSTYGRYSGRWFVFPAAKAGWKINNAPFMRNSDWISNLMIRGEYSINPNSRFSNTYSNYYYVLQQIRDVSGLVRAGVPNRRLGPERVHNKSLGLDFALMGDRITLGADIFEEYTKKMIVGTTASPVYGTGSIYRNDGEMRSRGFEVNFSAMITRGKFGWRVGGNIASYKSRIMSLGSDQEQVITLNGDLTVINRVGEAPYSYYGHTADGVYSSTEQANQDGLRTMSGYPFSGGDIRFRNTNGDNYISDDDREVLGSPDPKFYGGFYSKMTWKGFSLFANFAYSYGGKLYNGVRRYNESGNGFSNQAASMDRRWVSQGQQTDMPRVVFGDPAGNNRFSSRWIEDGSYVKLKELTLMWTSPKKLLFMSGFKVFVTGENLFCASDYKGMDPEFAYCYDMELLGMDLAKVPVPKYVKVGLILNF